MPGITEQNEPAPSAEAYAEALADCVLSLHPSFGKVTALPGTKIEETFSFFGT